MSWRVIADPSALAGGVRALLLQIAHPLAMAGVHDHSSFRTDPLGRLHRTAGYVTASTFGSTQEALAIAQRVKDVHPYVAGTAPDGREYAADDPDLLAWVGIALTSSFLAAYQRWAPAPLTPAEADQFVLEQSRIAALLDQRLDLQTLDAGAATGTAIRAGTMDLALISEGVLPATVAQMDARLADFSAALGVNDQGRDAIRFLRWPSALAPPVKGFYLGLFAGAAASLTPEHRSALEIRMGKPTVRLASGLARVLLGAMRAGIGPSPTVAAATARVTGARQG